MEVERRTRKKIVKCIQMTSLRFQTGEGRHQTSPASFRGERKKERRGVEKERGVSLGQQRFPPGCGREEEREGKGETERKREREMYRWSNQDFHRDTQRAEKVVKKSQRRNEYGRGDLLLKL